MFLCRRRAARISNVNRISSRAAGRQTGCWMMYPQHLQHNRWVTCGITSLKGWPVAAVRCSAVFGPTRTSMTNTIQLKFLANRVSLPPVKWIGTEKARACVLRRLRQEPTHQRHVWASTSVRGALVHLFEEILLHQN